MKSTSSYFEVYFRPRLQKPCILIMGVPGVGDVGTIALKNLIRSSNATLFARFYSFHFPDFLIAEEDGTCHLPCYEFWACETNKPNFIAVLGDVVPSSDEVYGCYEICSEILDFVKQFECKHVITLGGCEGVISDVGKIFVASSSKELMSISVAKGARIYEGAISGITGLMLGIANLHNLESTCILGVATRMTNDIKAGIATFRFLREILASDVFK